MTCYREQYRLRAEDIPNAERHWRGCVSLLLLHGGLFMASPQATAAHTPSPERRPPARQSLRSHPSPLGDLPGITFMPEDSTGRCNRWLTVILIDPAQFGCTYDQVRLALEAENIESRPVSDLLSRVRRRSQRMETN